VKAESWAMVLQASRMGGRPGRGKDCGSAMRSRDATRLGEQRPQPDVGPQHWPEVQSAVAQELVELLRRDVHYQPAHFRETLMAVRIFGKDGDLLEDVDEAEEVAAE